jgi:hypothetical protein
VAEQRVHFDLVGPAPPWPVALGCGVEVRVENRLQRQLGGGLHYPVPERRDTERPLTAAGLWDYYPAAPVRACTSSRQRPSWTAKPLLYPRRLDLSNGKEPGPRIGIQSGL